MVPVNPGKWLLHCHVNDHKQAGMETIFEVERKVVWGTYDEGIPAIIDIYVKRKGNHYSEVAILNV